VKTTKTTRTTEIVKTAKARNTKTAKTAKIVKIRDADEHGKREDCEDRDGNERDGRNRSKVRCNEAARDCKGAFYYIAMYRSVCTIKL
jgi:hypothetical protein